MASDPTEQEDIRDQFSELVSCDICLEVLVNPRLLPACDHFFCLNCIESLIKNKRQTCPTCRKPWDVPDGGPAALRPSRLVNKMKDILESPSPARTARHEDQAAPDLSDITPLNDAMRDISLANDAANISSDGGNNSHSVHTSEDDIRTTPRLRGHSPKLIKVNSLDRGACKSYKIWDMAVVTSGLDVVLGVVREYTIAFYKRAANNSFTPIKTEKQRMRRVVSTQDNHFAFTNKTDTIRIYTQEGSLSQRIRCQLSSVEGIAFTSDGHLVVVDVETKTILFIDYHTQEEVMRTLIGQNDVSETMHIAVNESNNVVISDWGNNRIIVIGRDGQTLGSADGQLSSPYGVCTDGDHIIVADSKNHRVSLYSPSGELDLQFGQHLLTKDNGTEYPRAVAIDDRGHLLVGDRNGNLFEIEFKQ
ncbi:unnamed protein product [Owenia fusiformis]|uniref:RING-type domain-containing protein n=1 Tax=Owenia fusiformis TaxID=6347 RepID=A0A8S4N5I9_OWEFU|nr:unnamed protein product [Owenia fusiformis]